MHGPGPLIPGPLPPGQALPGTWERLHPLSIVVRFGRASLPLLVILLLSVVSAPDLQAVYVRLAVIAVISLLAAVHWVVTRWRVADGALQIETGLVRRQSLRYPLSQIQAVDVVRPGVARALGMAELRLRMATGSGSNGSLAYLRSDQAEVVRGQLLALAHGLDAGVPPPPERVIYRVSTPLLAVSLAVSGAAIALVAWVVALVVLSVVAPSSASGAFGATAAVVLAFAGGLWRRFNAGYRLTVAEAPDGLRVQAGLVDRTAETIPAGRVQALRLVRPLTWRLFGWCRVEVDVAGAVAGPRRRRAEQRAGRTLLPVGTLEQAHWLVSRVVPSAPVDRMRPPPRARWKSPLRWRNLSYGVDDEVVVVTSGRVRQVTDWVPLAKLQSVRSSEGPLQRRLRLASVHLDTAGRSVHAVARDRDRDEAEAIVAWLAGAAARSRRAEPGSGRRRAAPPVGRAEGSAARRAVRAPATFPPRDP